MIVFRTASKKDALAIAKLHAISWQQNYRNTFSDNFLDHEVTKERQTVWQKRLADPPQNQFVQVAEINDVVVGFVCGYIDDHPEYGTLIDNLHVSSEYIGQRIGERLMALAATFLIRRDENASMYLWVLTSNLKAIKFYERIAGKALETVNDFDIGDREITKTRYHWPTMSPLLNLNSKE